MDEDFLDPEVNPTYEFEYLDDSDVEIELELDLVDDDPATEWFNDYGPDVHAIIQTQGIDFEKVNVWVDEPDMISLELFSLEMQPDPLDEDDVENIQLDMESTEADVPYEWQYWLHGVNEFPDDAVSAPPESGDVDPVTGNLVP